MTWQVDWTAPPTGVGSISFYFIGNAADGDGFDSNDWIYTGSYAIQDTTTPVLPTTWGEIKHRYR